MSRPPLWEDEVRSLLRWALLWLRSILRLLSPLSNLSHPIQRDPYSVRIHPSSLPWDQRSEIWILQNYLSGWIKFPHGPPSKIREIYTVYIYMLWSYYLGQVWGFSKLLSGPSQCYYLGQVCFRTIKIGVSGDFFFAQLSFCVFFCVQLFANFLKVAFFEKRVQKLGFSIFSVLI